MPKVSVIVPVYNAEQAIGRCLDSILNQEYKDLEVIPVDDGSKDHSGEILQLYADKDPRVKPIWKENGGVSSARNAALEAATGEYIQFMDADDWITMDSTKMLVRRMEEGRSDMVIANFYRVSGDRVAEKGEIEEKEVMTRNQFVEYMMQAPANYYYGVLWNKLYKRSIIEEHHIRMDENISFSEDFAFNLEYLVYAQFVAALQFPVYYYVKTEGSLVSKNMSPLRILEMKTTMFQYYNDFYKNIYDKETYRSERLNIARYLVAFATDDPAVGFKMSRLGNENTRFDVNRNLEVNTVSILYYMREVYEHYLNNVALQYGLDVKEVKCLAYLMMTDKPTPVREVARYAEVTYTYCIASMQRLALKKYVKMDYFTEGLPVSLTVDAGNIVNEIHNASKDLQNAAFRNFSDEEQEETKQLLERIAENLKDISGMVEENE